MKALFCVGNTVRTKVKVQFVLLVVSDKYTTRVLPGLVVQERGTACQFEFYITPLCSCTIDEAVVLSTGGC